MAVLVAVGGGVLVGAGVSLGSTVCVAVGTAVSVGLGVSVGTGVSVAVGTAVSVGVGVRLGLGVKVGLGVRLGRTVGVDPTARDSPLPGGPTSWHEHRNKRATAPARTALWTFPGLATDRHTADAAFPITRGTVASGMIAASPSPDARSGASAAATSICFCSPDATATEGVG